MNDGELKTIWVNTHYKIPEGLELIIDIQVIGSSCVIICDLLKNISVFLHYSDIV